MEFLQYLREGFGEDMATTETIIKSKWDKVVAIIKEAFDDQYADRKTALYRIQNEFINVQVAPKTIDVDFLKNKGQKLVSCINNLP